MNKFLYLLESFKAKRYLDRQWVMRVTAIPTEGWEATDILPGFNNGKFYVLEGGIKVEIEEEIDRHPLYFINESVTATPQHLSCIPEVLTTTIGRLLINAYIIDWAFDGKVSFMDGEISGKRLEKTFLPLLMDDTVSVEQYLKLQKAMNFITCFVDIACYALTPKALQGSPEVKALRKELLEKYAGQLNDPVVVALIDEQIAAADRKFMEGDKSTRFFKSGKSYDVVRKKIHGVQGGIPKLDDPSKMHYIESNLSEGFTSEELPAIINQLRSGSYDRGASTALGGEAADFANRVFQNLKIAEVDCGTEIGLPILVTKDDNLIGRYIVGKDRPITLDEYKSLIGKTIIVRDPSACKTGNGNLCERCMGDSERDSAIGPGPRMAEVCNVFTAISLAAFHGSASVTVEFDPVKDWI